MRYARKNMPIGPTSRASFTSGWMRRSVMIRDIPSAATEFHHNRTKRDQDHETGPQRPTRSPRNAQPISAAKTTEVSRRTAAWPTLSMRVASMTEPKLR